MLAKPFDYRDADLVLRSSSPDFQEFRVHKCILSASSAFFEDMFSLPQGPSECDGSLPIIDVSERAHILEYLLRIIYPIPNPAIPSLDDLVAVLEAAHKYEVEVAVDFLRPLLVAPQFVSPNPLRVYAIACRFGLSEEARTASTHTLSVKVADCPLTEDLEHLTAVQYHRLLSLHRQRAQAAEELIVYADEFKCMLCNGTHYGSFYAPRWWKDWECRAKEELRRRPTTDVIFSLPFLARSAQAGCERCGQSILEAAWFLEKLKREIDALPSTV